MHDYKLGQALRRAVESFPEELNVAIVATGGMEGAEIIMWMVMRSQPLEDFLKTRNVPDALYSVAGKDAGKQDWDK